MLCPIATTVDVEHVFSCGCLVLPHLCGCLAIQSTCASLWVGMWSSQGFMKQGDIRAALSADEIDVEEDNLAVGWDDIPVL